MNTKAETGKLSVLGKRPTSNFELSMSTGRPRAKGTHFFICVDLCPSVVEKPGRFLLGRFLSNFLLQGLIFVNMPLQYGQKPRSAVGLPDRLRVCFSLVGLSVLALASPALFAQDVAGVDFFEKKIRPILVERCYECHSVDKKVKGGLLLDTAEGWKKGGDTGPAIIPGDLEKSLVIKAVQYHDTDFQMPPKNKLPQAEIAALEQWVKMGAPDPRTHKVTLAKSGMTVEEGRNFWAYRPPQKTAVPSVKNAAWSRGDVDKFLLAKLEAKNLQPNGDTDRATLARRVYFDLIGLPPTPEQIDAFVKDKSPDAYAKLVDGLLASPHFGERWGRHWLDVVRYAESVTLRGLVYKEAWRYRDYVIDSFNQDVPFNQLVQEHVAGDLMTGSIEQRQRQILGTAFLAMGNTTLEEQDKKQLAMDVVDEQLDTIGKAFMGQTFGCARCHDHKFDPIPTKDYYAMAGILRSTRSLETANVSRWVEVGMPLPPEEEAKAAAHDKAVAALEKDLKELKAKQSKMATATLDKGSEKMPKILAPDALPGVVVDDEQAKRVGEWTHSVYSKSFIGTGFLHDGESDKGKKTLTFAPEIRKTGNYEVRLAYVHAANRSTSVPVTIFTADGEVVLQVNQKEAPPIMGRFVSLGRHRFEKGGAGFVLVANEGTDGVVGADAVQFIPVEELQQTVTLAAADKTEAPNPKKEAEAAAMAAEVKRMEAEMKRLTESGSVRPKVMSVEEEKEPGDTYVHIRGSVHTLGDKVPRGFLQVATYGQAPTVSEKQSGRLEFGEWLASRNNPLTARVYVNRAWHWLFGEGLVRTVDNFGTTGETPSHPELLDHLAIKFMDEGWSTKKLVRELVLSRAYQMSSTAHPMAKQADPENRLLAHANRRRLEAEQIRDAILTLSGQMTLEMGGATIKPNTNADYNYKHDETRRSVYMPVLRNSLPDLFEAFDFADPSMVVGKRNTSTVPPQALYLMNHPFVVEQAQLAAKRLSAEAGDDTAKIERAYRSAMGRMPTSGEREVALRFVTQATNANREELWGQFYQALFASLDFRYLN